MNKIDVSQIQSIL